jgi:ribosomal protein S18 acetylase RimI-like enzyme
VSFVIREVYDTADIRTSAIIIRNSFKTAADEFGLTRENCPTHPSFITVPRLKEAKKKGAVFFGGFLNNKQVAFVAVEKAEGAAFYMERLAVLPAYRHNGYGKTLVERVVDYIRSQNGGKISIGIINESSILKEWYKRLGFRETGTKQFNHLLFKVCFMEKEIW